MASSLSDPPPIRDIEFYKALVQRDLELIEFQLELLSIQQKEINRLTKIVNKKGLK